MPRRLKSKDGILAPFILWVILAACSHFANHTLANINIRLYLLPLGIMVPIYLGYKGGRWWGLAAGVLSTLPATLISHFLISSNNSNISPIALLYETSQPSYYLLFIRGFTLQFMLLAAFVGYLSGWLFDRLDQFLNRHQTSLEELFPDCLKGLYLGKIYYFLSRWGTFGSAHPPDETSPSKAAAPADGKGLVSSLFKMLFIVVLILLNYPIPLFFGSLYFFFPPELLSAVLILLIAYLSGIGRALLVALLVWAGSIALLGLPPETFHPILDAFFGDWGKIAKKSLESYKNFTENFGGPETSAISPTRMIGLFILIWWVGKIAETLRDAEKRQTLTRIWKGWQRPEFSTAFPSKWLLLILPLLAWKFDLSINTVIIRYHPMALLFVVIVIHSYKHRPNIVSNRLLTLFFLLMLLPGLKFEHLSFSFEPSDVFVLGLLAILPLIAANMDLRSLPLCRLLAFGYLVTLTVHQIYLRGIAYRFVHVFSLGFEGYHSYLLSWLIDILLFEAAARIINRRALKSALKTPKVISDK